jgi:hypothetical protein
MHDPISKPTVAGFELPHRQAAELLLSVSDDPTICRNGTMIMGTGLPRRVVCDGIYLDVEFMTRPL